MINQQLDAVTLERETERLRQEAATFEQRRRQDHQWFCLRLAMGIVAAIVLPLTAFVCASIVLAPSRYDPSVVRIAMLALTGDILGLFVAVWKLIIGTGTVTTLAPVTVVDTGRVGAEHNQG